jgi:hypothetical protein
MTQITDEQWQQLDAAVERVGAKLRALHEELSDEAHLALHLILGQGRPAGTGEDVSGYAYDLRLSSLDRTWLSLSPEHCSTGKVNPMDPTTWSRARPPFTV